MTHASTRSLLILIAAVLACPGAIAQTTADSPPRTGAAAYGDWSGDAPGIRRRITERDMPAPFATGSVSGSPSVVKAPPGARLRVPAGFTVELFAGDLEEPRLLRAAPNGDIFVAESAPGRIRILRAADGADKPIENSVFVSGLDAPFGIAFYPPGADPRFVYVADTNAVLRIPYRSGDLKARGAPETVVRQLARSPGGHWTRDIAFAADGRRMFVSVGSASNVAEGMASRDDLTRWQDGHGIGAGWGDEEYRADVLVFDPDGRNGRTWATGLRNCVGLAVQADTGELWCATNERDGLGDDLPPDFVTRVREGGFYGWPWYYIGAHEDPRHRGERPDLMGKALLPDVLLQPHSAPLEMAFYAAPAGAPAAFPASYRGDAFVALHGSWNRARRTGYKIVRIIMRSGAPTGEYEDFLTGFVVNDDSVWGRPVGVAVAHDGALLVSEDGNGTIWRIAYRGGR